MNKFAIQKFTTPKTGKSINVNAGDIFAVQHNDGSIPTGMIYDGAGALLVTNSGYYLPVKEDVSAATELWLGGLNRLTGTA